MRKSWLAFAVALFLLAIIWKADGLIAAAQEISPGDQNAENVAPRNRSYPVLGRGYATKDNIWSGERINEPEQLQISPAASIDLPSAEYFQNIAFQSYRDSTWEIYQAFNVDKEYPPVARLTNDTWYDGEPSFNQGCSLITFTSERDGNPEIYILNVANGGIQRLSWNAAADYSPVWSYDDANIVFVSERDGNPEIYTMARDGSSLLRITNDPSVDFSPTYSPDGNQIAWLRVLDSQYGIIVVANRDGSNPHTVGVPLRFVYDLIWSGNGSYFAFDYDGNLNGWNELAMMNVDGSNLHTLWNPGVEKEAWAGSWSVTSAYIFYSYLRYTLYQDQYYIYRVDTYKFNLNMGASYIFIDKFDFDQSACPTDTSIPQSWVAPLPYYSRADGFWIGWKAFDPGPADIYRTMINYRLNTSSDWVYWIGSAETVGIRIFAASPGQTVYFQSQAEDWAQHYELWPGGNGDTSTNLFSWMLHGTVTDPRGGTLPGATIQLSPTAWNSLGSATDGHYMAYLATSGEHQFTCQLAGYAELPASSLELQRDEQFNTYLLPGNNWLDNGGFEDSRDPFDDWQLSSEPDTPVLDRGHSGTYSARLGMPCEPPCFTEALEFPDITHTEQEATIAADQFGNVHILYEYRIYLMRDAQGTWHEPETIGNLGDPGNSSMRPALAVDSQGGLHAIVVGADVSIEYYYKPVGGSWELQHDLAGGSSATNPTISVNHLGTVFITYRDSFKTYYLVRQASGIWNMPQVLASPTSFAWAQTVDPAGNFHVVAQHSGLTVYHRFLPDGTEVFQNIVSQEAHLPISLAAGVDETLHLILQDVEYGAPWYYLTRSPNDIWAIPQTLEDKLTDASMVVDSNGTVHVLGLDRFDVTYPVYYYRKNADEAYFWRTFAFPGSYSGDISLAVDSQDSLHTAWGDWFILKYRETMLWSAESPIWLATDVSVPINAHQPTFSFMYRLESSQNVQPVFEVSVTDDHNTSDASTSLSFPQSNDWTLGWIDLQPWVGQNVTITFYLSQPVGTLPSFAWIDSASAGEWLTPAVTGVNPTWLDAWSGGWLTITGSNFPESPIVRLGSILLREVVYIDEQTLQAYVPADTPIGSYGVFVLTSADQIGVAPQAVEIGYHILLPLIGK